MLLSVRLPTLASQVLTRAPPVQVPQHHFVIPCDHAVVLDRLQDRSVVSGCHRGRSVTHHNHIILRIHECTFTSEHTANEKRGKVKRQLSEILEDYAALCF